MDRSTINTDHRLLDILESGRRFQKTIDPQGLLSGGVPTELFVDLHTKKWKLTLTFREGKTLMIYGKQENNICTVNNIKNRLSPVPDNYTAEAAKTVSELLGDLSRVPANLKPFLSRGGFSDANAGENGAVLPKILREASDALFYNVEDRTHEPTRYKFRYWSIRYNLNKSDEPEIANVKASLAGKNSVIMISMTVDIYGLGNKKVMLSKNLGENHQAVIDCQAETDEKPIPSLKVAFDLDGKIPTLYFPERNEHIGTGKKQRKTK